MHNLYFYNKKLELDIIINESWDNQAYIKNK